MKLIIAKAVLSPSAQNTQGYLSLSEKQPVFTVLLNQQANPAVARNLNFEMSQPKFAELAIFVDRSLSTGSKALRELQRILSILQHDISSRWRPTLIFTQTQWHLDVAWHHESFPLGAQWFLRGLNVSLEIDSFVANYPSNVSLPVQINDRSNQIKKLSLQTVMNHELFDQAPPALKGVLIADLQQLLRSNLKASRALKSFKIEI